MSTTTLHIAARRWFQRSYGNTYHTVAVYLDGDLIGVSDRTYGYGTHYLHTAGTILKDAGRLEELTGSDDPYVVHDWRTLADRGIVMTENVEDVDRRRDLHDPADYAAFLADQAAR